MGRAGDSRVSGQQKPVRPWSCTSDQLQTWEGAPPSPRAALLLTRPAPHTLLDGCICPYPWRAHSQHGDLLCQHLQAPRRGLHPPPANTRWGLASPQPRKGREEPARKRPQRAGGGRTTEPAGMEGFVLREHLLRSTLGGVVPTSGQQPEVSLPPLTAIRWQGWCFALWNPGSLKFKPIGSHSGLCVR